MDLRALAAARKFLEANEVSDDWPRSKKGHYKLACYPWEADRLIAAGALEEDDILRIGEPIPVKQQRED